MTVVITGAGGFVGRQLVGALLGQGKQVAALDSHLGGLADHPNLQKFEGDLSDSTLRQSALSEGCEAVVHLATVPGGAAEADPAASRRVNIDAMYNLMEEAAAAGDAPRLVYASSIAVFGDPLPADGVDDNTPLSPRMIYGGHKAMMETAVAMLSNRGVIDGVSVRLPGILARPKGPSGMKSAFMSDLFHALSAGKEFVCPVSREATIWAQSVQCVTDNFVHALTLDSTLMPRTRVVTLPALCITMGDLTEEIARQTGSASSLVSYAPDAALEAAFGAHPPLSTPAAERAGFAHDGSVANLVTSALATLS